MTLLCASARLARRPLFIPRGVIHESSVRNTGKMNGGGSRRRGAPGKGSSNNRGIKRELKVCRSRICVKRRKGRVIRRRDIEATTAARMKRNDGEGWGWGMGDGGGGSKQAERVHPRRLCTRAFFLSLRIEPFSSRRHVIYLAFRPIGSSAEIITGSFRRVVIPT